MVKTPLSLSLFLLICSFIDKDGSAEELPSSPLSSQSDTEKTGSAKIHTTTPDVIITQPEEQDNPPPQKASQARKPSKKKNLRQPARGRGTAM
jgi:hypothetical protein